MNVILVWKDYKILSAFGRDLDVTCLVRTREQSGDMHRADDEVVFTYSPDGKRYPYMPSPFPIGTWDITDIRQVRYPVIVNNLRYIKGWKIYTNAQKEVETWDIAAGESGPSYVKPNGSHVIDTGYMLHGSDSITTVGCGRVVNDSLLEWLALTIIDRKASGDTFQLEVI